MTPDQLNNLLRSLCALPDETEWVEFKVNDKRPDDVGEYISALSNAAGLLGKEAAYLVWGVEDGTHRIVGTTFQPRRERIGNQELESWLAVHLEPAVDFRFHEFTAQNKPVVLLEIPSCRHTPVRWKEAAHVRVGTYKKKLKDFPEKERTLWLILSRVPFEKGVARRDVSEDEALSLLNFASYYDLTGQTLPAEKRGILDRLAAEKMVIARPGSRFDITNFGAILFAKRLSEFESLGRKAVRVITYAGANRVAGKREHVADAGYACGFEALISYVNSQLPANEHIGEALRVETRMYPEIAIRELVPNAIIHQDFDLIGDSPLVEIFPDRIEITSAIR